MPPMSSSWRNLSFTLSLVSVSDSISGYYGNETSLYKPCTVRNVQRNTAITDTTQVTDFILEKKNQWCFYSSGSHLQSYLVSLKNCWRDYRKETVYWLKRNSIVLLCVSFNHKWTVDIFFLWWRCFGIFLVPKVYLCYYRMQIDDHEFYFRTYFVVKELRTKTCVVLWNFNISPSVCNNASDFTQCKVKSAYLSGYCKTDFKAPIWSRIRTFVPAKIWSQMRHFTASVHTLRSSAFSSQIHLGYSKNNQNKQSIFVWKTRKECLVYHVTKIQSFCLQGHEWYKVCQRTIYLDWIHFSEFVLAIEKLRKQVILFNDSPRTRRKFSYLFNYALFSSVHPRRGTKIVLRSSNANV